ncbi:hypothetical protein [Acinetobacter calcoaceticus]|uniref:hypothetical protein n=1 Tax=Acinetobacter calcoaceticus TaxID=471 RepID=UPI003A8C44A7
MQKITFYLISLLLVFFICLGLSIVIKDFYKIEGDYLSAFSTLVAAGTAFFLVADWKEQSLLNIFLQTSSRVTILCDDLFDSYDNFYNFLYDMKDNDLDEIQQNNFRVQSKIFMNTIENLLLEMDRQKILLKKIKNRRGEYSKYYQNLLNFDSELMALVKKLDKTKYDYQQHKKVINIYKVLTYDNLRFREIILDYKYLIKDDSNHVISDLLS